MASGRHSTLYTGVTSDLVARVWQHRTHYHLDSFTSRYNVTRLVWFEEQGCADGAILREKRIKEWRRAWKVELIETCNPKWHDLWDEIVQ